MILRNSKFKHSSFFASNSPITMAPKKRLKSTASTSRAPATQGNSSIPHVLNKYNIVSMDAEHARHYDAVVSRKICAPYYLDVEMLTTLYLYDDLVILLRNLGWANFVILQEPVYELLVWEL